MSEWNGFKYEEFDFEGRTGIVVSPEKPNGKWLLKTVYWNAFPAFEIEMVKRGYHLAHVSNISRWTKYPEDIDAKARFADFISEKYRLKKKCVPVGMSCGGMQALYFAARHPECVSVVYADAPVINFLSCPAGVTGHTAESKGWQELQDLTGMDLSALISYRNHPLDHFPELIANNIPIVLVCGDSDTVVPFEENGALLDRYYREHGGNILTIVKKGCDHHPHGLEDNTPIIDFVLKYDQ